MKVVRLFVFAFLFSMLGQANARLCQFAPPPEGARYLYPHFSPDGRQLLFFQTTDNASTLCIAPFAKTLQVTTLDTAAMKPYRLSFRLGIPTWMDWLPDSQRFATIVERIGTNNNSECNLFLFNTNGMLERTLFAHVDQLPNIQNVAIAPDGKTIALTTWSNGNDHLFVLTNFDAASMREVGNPESYIAGMTWAADSKTLIFSASNMKDDTGISTGTYDLWRYDLKSASLTNFTHTDGDSEVNPILTQDGKTLFYTAGKNSLTLNNPLAENGINRWLSMRDVCATPVSAFMPKFICTGTMPVVSQDGKMIFVYQQRPGMGTEGREGAVCYGVIFDSTGRELISIYFGPEVTYLAEGFAFSPDGDSYAFAKGGAIWTDTIRWDVPTRIREE